MAAPRKSSGRPVVGSRTPTSRPRAVAGRRGAPPTDARPDLTHEPPWPDESGADGPAPEAPGQEEGPRRLARSRITRSLGVAVLVLLVVAALEAWYLWGQPDPVVSASRPVVIGEVAHRSAVETAQKSVEDVLTYGYQDFDAEIDEAASLMTPAFVEEFRVTADDVRQRFVRQRIEQEVRVVAASVVQASPDQVQALLFLEQYVIRPATGTDLHSYRALVTLARDEGGWLIADLETR